MYFDTSHQKLRSSSHRDDKLMLHGPVRRKREDVQTSMNFQISTKAAVVIGLVTIRKANAILKTLCFVDASYYNISSL